MTFTTRLKEEITKNDVGQIESLVELSAFIKYAGQIKKNKITLIMENASVARRIYKDIKSNFGINIKITIRNQKRFRVKQIYILEITEKVEHILETLNIMKDNKNTLPEEFFLSTQEEKAAFLKGAFMACGSINDPSTAGYHLEFTSDMKKEGTFLSNLLKEFNIISKVLKRNNHYMTYIKSAEMISDLIRLLGATNSFFYFEDIRIYRDHKNMTNRLNNCEQANVDKIIGSAMKQVEDIELIDSVSGLDLLSEKERVVAVYRMKYKEASLQELSEIITIETGNKITKSGLNHRFRKIKEIANELRNK